MMRDITGELIYFCEYLNNDFPAKLEFDIMNYPPILWAIKIDIDLDVGYNLFIKSNTRLGIVVDDKLGAYLSKKGNTATIYDPIFEFDLEGNIKEHPSQNNITGWDINNTLKEKLDLLKKCIKEHFAPNSIKFIRSLTC